MKIGIKVIELEEWLTANVDPLAADMGVTRNQYYALVMRHWINRMNPADLLAARPVSAVPASLPPINPPGSREKPAPAGNSAPTASKRGPGRPPKVRVIDPELLKPVTYHITDPFLQKAAADPRVLQKLGFLPEHLDAKGIPKNWTIDREFDDASLNSGPVGGFVPPEVDFEQMDD